MTLEEQERGLVQRERKEESCLRMYASIQFKLRTLIKRGEGEFRGCFELRCSAPKHRLAPDRDKGNGVVGVFAHSIHQPTLEQYRKKTVFAGKHK